jgi:hypothetical protein
VKLFHLEQMGTDKIDLKRPRKIKFAGLAVDKASNGPTPPRDAAS